MDDLTHAVWHKSSRSGGGNECVEVANLTGGWAVRDSKDPSGPTLWFTPAQWAAFTTGISTGELD